MIFRPQPAYPHLHARHQGQALDLRPFRRADAPIFAKHIEGILTQTNSADFLLTFPRPFRPGHARRRIHETHGWLRQNRGWSLAIEWQGQLVGQAQLVCHPPRNSLAEAAYWIARPFQGQGLALSAMKTLIHAAVQHWPLETIEATLVPGNQASLKILTRLGFCKRELARIPYRIQGGWRQKHAELLIYTRPAIFP